MTTLLIAISNVECGLENTTANYSVAILLTAAVILNY